MNFIKDRRAKPRTTRGVLTFAYGQEYQRMAYAQALTLKAKGVPITVVVPNLEYTNLADVANVIKMSRNMSKFEWESYACELSPYDVTIKTDADVLFPISFDINAYFFITELTGLVSGTSCNLENELVECALYRARELELDWPSFYSAVFGFTKSKGDLFFQQAKLLFSNWWKLKRIVGDLPATTDSVFSYAYMYTQNTNRIVNGLRFIHAKQGVCGYAFNDKWSRDVPHHVDAKGNLFVNGRIITLPFHYFDKDFLSPAILKGLEDVLR